MLDQADFLNLVVRGETDLAPRELLALTQSIEARFGRDRSRERRKGPRTLDIDILLYGELVVDTPELSIPHPGMAERAFVLAPIEEVSPGLRHPVSGEAFATYLAAAGGQGIYLHAGPPV